MVTQLKVSLALDASELSLERTIKIKKPWLKVDLGYVQKIEGVQ